MKKAIALAAVTLLLAAGCSNTPEPGDRSLVAETPGDDRAEGQKDGRKKAGGKKNAGGKKSARQQASEGTEGSSAAGSGSTIQGDVDVPGASEEQEYPTGLAELTEPQADAKTQGITPGYAELLAVRVEGLGEEVQITLTFDGQVPDKMPNDKTIMVVGFQMIRGEDEGYAFAGQATQEGWKPYAGGKNKRTDFPGSFEIDGDQIVMVIPWSYPRGAYPFKWVATSNWFQSLANTTHYKFDLVPNKDQANYPG